jgi:hypothetical protein
MKFQPSKEEREQLGAAGTAAGLGCSIVVSVILCIGGGIAADDLLGTSPVCTLIGVALAIAAAAGQLWELARVGRPEVKQGLVTRQIQRFAPRSMRHPSAKQDGE